MLGSILGRKRRGSRSSRRNEPTQKRHILWGVFACILVVLIVVLLWHLTRLEVFTIRDVTVKGGETIPHALVEDTVSNVLQGTYMKIIPHRFSFFYPHDSVAEAVSALPKVKESTVERNGTELSVNFTEYEPHALWCLSSDDAVCFYIDETGYAFAPGPRLVGGALVRHIIEAETELQRKQVFEPSALSALNHFFSSLKDDMQFRVTEVVYTRDGDLVVRIGGGGELRMRNDGAYDVVYENLKTILASDEFGHLEPGNFWYIDLRFGNKVFVNEEIPTLDVGTSTATSSENEL